MDARVPAVKVRVSAKTDAGRKRQTNEDACSITELATGDDIYALDVDRTVELSERGILLALSDGMGGHQAGEVASAMVLESLAAELRRDTQVPVAEQLEHAIQAANRAVRTAADSASNHGMGATLVAVFVRDTQAYIAEVGDSRGYLLRAGRLRQMTRDQSLVQLLVDQGVMTPTEARKAPGKNVILQAMGLDSDVRVAIGRLELRRGDRLLLCSDGITNELSDDELREVLTDSAPSAACDTMIALANERGGSDNQTVIVADVLGEDLAEPVEFETVTSTFEVLQAFQQAARNESPRRSPVMHAGGAEVASPRIAAPGPTLPDLPLDTPAPQPPSRQSWISSLLGKLSLDRRK